MIALDDSKFRCFAFENETCVQDYYAKFLYNMLCVKVSAVILDTMF